MADNNPLVTVIVGSASDADTMAPCRQALKDLGIAQEAKVFSAHRTPSELLAYLETLEQRGVQVIIAAAGMAAHLAGVIAAHTQLPVLGVPVAAGALQGVDALLSTSQMPPGVPVACMGIGKPGAKNAAFQAARMIGLHNKAIRQNLDQAVNAMREKVLASSLPEIDG